LEGNTCPIERGFEEEKLCEKPFGKRKIAAQTQGRVLGVGEKGPIVLHFTGATAVELCGKTRGLGIRGSSLQEGKFFRIPD